MKKSILTFVLFTFFGTSLVLGQAKETVKFGICGTSENIIKQTDISKCNVLMPLNKNLNISSFTLAVFTKGNDAKAKGVYVDYACIGNKLSDAAMEALKKAPVGTKFLIESIVASDGKTESKYPGISMEIK